MQRALLSSLRRQTGFSSSVNSMRVVRPTVIAPRISMIRFASTEASKEEGKEEGSETQETKSQDTETAAETAKEAEGAKAEVSEIDELKAKLTKKDKELADMKNHYARAIADFRNLQESTKLEKQKARDFALQKFAKDLLESVDNFDLALNAVKEDTLKTNAEVKNLYDGVDMTRNVFEKTLARHGIEKVDPIGQQFDPNQHEATFEIAQPDKEPGTVFHVQQNGYTLNSRVLRPAKVGVVKDTEN
mmetsp:Transcript_5944/g.5876  ORF Transcript_5944/g.5876 Transcript_5944/m.5876 type:complete len:246 (+) Transcript_5944:33-770(+)